MAEVRGLLLPSSLRSGKLLSRPSNDSRRAVANSHGTGAGSSIQVKRLRGTLYRSRCRLVNLEKVSFALIASPISEATRCSSAIRRRNLRRSVAIALTYAVIISQQAHSQTFTPTPAEQAELAVLSRPESWFVEQAKGQRVTIDGQVLDAKLQFALGKSAVSSSSASDPGATPEGRSAMRERYDRSWTYRTKVTPPMAAVRELVVPGRGGAIPVRLYRPQTGASAALPLIVYYHGGGWLFGSIAASDRAMRLLANEAGVIVVSVGYRLAPEHPYPAAWDDAEDAFAWVAAHAVALGGDPIRVAVGGDSAGGNLAVNVSARRLAKGVTPPAYQLLYYPAVDLSREYRSWQLFGEGFGLDRAFADYVMPRTFPDTDVRHPEVSPIRAATLEGMPPTILATAGFDILRDAGRAYADRLRNEGSGVIYLNYSTLNHSFLQATGVVADAERAATDTARIFGTALRSAQPLAVAGAR